MNPLTIILAHEHTTERLRTRYLTTQKWAKVLECDAALDTCKRLRAAIARDAETETSGAKLPLAVPHTHDQL